ncbi:dethiobiotin synthase [Larsenimonas rhizosphaerae]|uniref:ATP-dependent dethiobiotin synthetase BioD n=1 Tax=Larsenimonas rhizosphaerae TaxID=2944682 RepID=A0AA42CTI2_9GAMM|nr:dethiobiotin synthase [Larsenimonas rhizosphaerae]MCX2523249.1 dethiobiotin synthase [Larsenimonas rhizosphaerae]
MTSAFFVTGTDTDAGKTTISAALLYRAQQQGLSTAAGKPIASGSELTAAGLSNSDTRALRAQCSLPLTEQDITPWCFAPAIAPHVAATQADTPLHIAELARAMQRILNKRADLTLIEGAGGWRVPINAQEDLCALAPALSLPVILVVGVRLGAINHARLTLEAIRADGLVCAGWVANGIDPMMERQSDTLQCLYQSLDAPCLGTVPFSDNPEPRHISSFLQLPSEII